MLCNVNNILASIFLFSYPSLAQKTFIHYLVQLIQTNLKNHYEACLFIHTLYLISAYLIGISNCSWSSCRHGCTAEVYKCWQVEVNFTLVPTSHPIPPPWGSLTSLAMPRSAPGPILEKSHVARLYPNVRGCGYPPDLQCPGQ